VITQRAGTVPLGFDVDVLQDHPAAASAVTEEALRLALRLRECPASQGGRLILFVPASSGDSAERLVYETTRALEQLGDGPILVLDLEHRARAAGDWLSQWPAAAGYHAGPLAPGVRRAATAADAPVLYARPCPAPAAAVAYLASPEFSGFVAAAREQFGYVIGVVGPIGEAVESLVAATLCDGVVLSVTAHRTTMAEVREASRQLAAARATVLGFVVSRATKG
jgi:hypothetical protein